MESVDELGRRELMCQRTASEVTKSALDMSRVLTAFTLLWSSGLQAEDLHSQETGNMRLMGGASRCVGGLEMKLHNDWKPVDDILFDWNLRTASVVCRQLDCGSILSAKIKHGYLRRVWKIKASSVQSGSALRDDEPRMTQSSTSSLEITCSESVRLVNGTSLCSGRLEVKANHSWSTVCKSHFDRQDAEVVCRELGCGAPSELQLALYEKIQAPVLTKEFQCRGNESSVLDCESYESTVNTCSSIRLACSEPDNIRLVDGGSRCTGALEMKLQDEWKPVDVSKGDLTSADLVCRQLKCGSAVSTEIKLSAGKPVWGIISAHSGSALREHIATRPWHSSTSLKISCSDLLFQPVISISPSIDGVQEASDFTISCSIKPQYPGGSFRLIFTSSNTTHNYTQKAVNHTAHFLFPTAELGHQGNYSCVYQIYIFSRNFSSESQPLFLTISAALPVFITRLAGLLLISTVLSAIYFYKKATRGQQTVGHENIGQDFHNVGASGAEVGPELEAEAQGTDL